MKDITDSMRLKILSIEVLEDGRSKYTMEGGGVCIVPPLPGKEWQDRVSRDLSAINYRIIRRVEAEEAMAAAGGA